MNARKEHVDGAGIQLHLAEVLPYCAISFAAEIKKLSFILLQADYKAPDWEHRQLFLETFKPHRSFQYQLSYSEDLKLPVSVGTLLLESIVEQDGLLQCRFALQETDEYFPFFVKPPED